MLSNRQDAENQTRGLMFSLKGGQQNIHRGLSACRVNQEVKVVDYCVFIQANEKQMLGTIGLFENEWNDFDQLNEKTRMLHTTRRKHQPWRTGLPIDYRPADTFRLFPPRHWLRRTRRALFGDYGMLGRYGRHPDRNQENFFFGLVRECLDKGLITEERLRTEMARDHLRHDALELIERVPPLAA